MSNSFRMRKPFKWCTMRKPIWGRKGRHFARKQGIFSDTLFLACKNLRNFGYRALSGTKLTFGRLIVRINGFIKHIHDVDSVVA